MTPVSVVVVSRQRPRELRRCLLGLSQLAHGNHEVIVVADPAGLAAAAAFGVRTVAFDEANISMARNLGAVAAKGEVLAFIDDDAVPEPQWLRNLAAPFVRDDVAAAGGPVVGTNGISLQWAGGTVGRLLDEGPLPRPEEGVFYRSMPGRAIEIKGVNCAYRRSRLLAAGGFDPALPYHMDETELNLRLAEEAPLVAFVPNARVHHRKAESPLRRADRVPRSLARIGASTAVALRRGGASQAEVAEARQRLEAAQLVRLNGLTRARRLSTDEALRLAADWRAGFEAGLSRPLPPLSALADQPDGAFRPADGRTRPLRLVSGRVWQKRALGHAARAAVTGGEIVRLFLFSPTTLYHRIEFTDDGVWQQTGGLFGKSDRTDPPFRPWRFASRLARESGRFIDGFRNS